MTMRLIYRCDGCEEETDPKTDDFQEAREHLREERWRTLKDGSVWKHYCPDCKGDA